MNWHCLQAPAGESLAEDCLDGIPFALWKTLPSRVKSYLRDNGTESLNHFLFGTMFGHLTEGHGGDPLTSCLVGSHVKTYPLREPERESPATSPDCGDIWRGSFVRLDQDLCLWKTHQCSLLGDLEPFCGTWPNWGTMRGGACWEHTTLERRISGTAYGLGQPMLPTPTATDWSPTRGTPYQTKNGTFRLMRKDGKSSRLGLDWHARNWPTPTAHNAKETASPSEYKLNTPTLAAQVGGKLNPPWVEWLMGWPTGWTDLQPLAMDKFPLWLHLHGKY